MGNAAENDDPLPPGVHGKDFKTLQAMITKGIKDAESGASQLEATITEDNGKELQQHREQLRRRREEEAAARQREKELAREKRRREDEERRKRQAEELEAEFRMEQQQREERQSVEAVCRREHNAAVRIQASMRGRRSRAGHCYTGVQMPRVVVHTTPWTNAHEIS